MIKNKKLMSLIILIAFLLNGFASVLPITASQAHGAQRKHASRYTKKPVKTVSRKQKPKPAPEKPEFKIPLVEESIPTVEGAKKIKYSPKILKDEEVIYSQANKDLKKKKQSAQLITEPGIPVVVKPLKKFRTKNKRIKVKREGLKGSEKYSAVYPQIGETKAFKVIRDVKKDEKILLAKDTVIYGKVGELSPRAMGGAPAELVLEDFQYTDTDGRIKKLNGTINADGCSLSIWIALVELGTTPFLFGLAAPALRILPGGQAVITPRKTYTVYYSE